MDFISLENPTPRSVPLDYSLIEIPFAEVHQLTPPLADLPLIQFHKILTQRRSRYSFDRLSKDNLSTLLWSSCRTVAKFYDQTGQLCRLKPTPSAGARHPIHVVAIDSSFSASMYLSDSHSFGLLPINSNEIESFKRLVDDIIPSKNATILLFAAHFEATLSKYDHGESLIWRDSGALGQTMHLVAESLALKFCLLGITGEPFTSRLFGGKLTGVGGCVVGE